MLNEDAQATVEYMLMLSITVMIAVGITKKILGPLYIKLTKNLMKTMDNALFTPGGFHSFPLGR
mgnify:FL=1